MAEFIELFSQSSTYISLLTLTLMEIVLGVDNIVFISILASRLPASEQARARNIGLGFALGSRILLLLGIAWIAGLTTPLLTIFEHSVTGRDLILICGGIFLLAKSTMEIHGKLEGEETTATSEARASFWKIVFQIVLLDIVFSFDSVITAVGLVQNISIMIIAIIISMVVMLLSAKKISSFIEMHPTIKMLALSFLLMIGTLLVAEGFHVHVPKGYVYFAMAFSLFVEVLNIKLQAKSKPLKLRDDAGL